MWDLRTYEWASQWPIEQLGTLFYTILSNLFLQFSTLNLSWSFCACVKKRKKRSEENLGSKFQLITLEKTLPSDYKGGDKLCCRTCCHSLCDWLLIHGKFECSITVWERLFDWVPSSNSHLLHQWDKIKPCSQMADGMWWSHYGERRTEGWMVQRAVIQTCLIEAPMKDF